MQTPNPNTTAACYEPSPSEAILFGYIAEFIIDQTLLNNKIAGIKEGWTIHEQLSTDIETKPFRFLIPMGEYLIQDEALRRDINRMEFPESHQV